MKKQAVKDKVISPSKRHKKGGELLEIDEVGKFMLFGREGGDLLQTEEQ